MVKRGFQCNGLIYDSYRIECKKKPPHTTGGVRKIRCVLRVRLFVKSVQPLTFKDPPSRQMATDGITRAVRCAPAMHQALLLAGFADHLDVGDLQVTVLGIVL